MTLSKRLQAVADMVTIYDMVVADIEQIMDIFQFV